MEHADEFTTSAISMAAKVAREFIARLLGILYKIFCNMNCSYSENLTGFSLKPSVSPDEKIFGRISIKRYDEAFIFDEFS